MNLFDQLNHMGTTVVIASHNRPLMDKFHHNRIILESGQARLEKPEKEKSLKQKLGDMF